MVFGFVKLARKNILEPKNHDKSDQMLLHDGTEYIDEDNNAAPRNRSNRKIDSGSDTKC